MYTSDTVIKDTNIIVSLINSKNYEDFIRYASNPANSDNIRSVLEDTEYTNKFIADIPKDKFLQLVEIWPDNPYLFYKISKNCDDHPRFMEAAEEIVKNPFKYGNAFQYAIKCLTPDTIRKFVKYRFLDNDLKLSLEGKLGFKDVKERDATSISGISFDIERKSVLLVMIEHLKDVLDYILTLNPKSPLIENLLNYPTNALSRINHTLWDDNTKKALSYVLTNFPLHKVFPTAIANYYFHGRRLTLCGLCFENLMSLEIITPSYIYSEFKKSVEEKNEEFRKIATSNFFTSSYTNFLTYLRALNPTDKVYETLFEWTIQSSVNDFIEKGSSQQFYQCAQILASQHNVNVDITFEDAVKFINEVAKRIVEKKPTLITDANTFPAICYEILKLLEPRNSYIDTIEYIEDEIRNKIVIGAIRHPTDESKFAQIITNNQIEELVRLLCKVSSVSDICLVLPASKRSTLDKYSFMPGKMPTKPQPTTVHMSIIEIYLQSSKFWESKDSKLLINGYSSYKLFVDKILLEAYKKDDMELKKCAISCYERLLQFLTRMKAAQNLQFRMQMLAEEATDPLAILIGSSLDEDFPVKIVNNSICHVPAEVLNQILVTIISSSHMDGINLDKPFAKMAREVMKALDNLPNKFFQNKGIEKKFLGNVDWKRNRKENMDLKSTKTIPDFANKLITKDTIPLNYIIPEYQPINVDSQYIMKGNYAAWLEIVKIFFDFCQKYKESDYESDMTSMYIAIQKFLISQASSVMEMKIYLENENQIYDSTDFEIFYNEAFFPMISELKPNIELNEEVVKNLFMFEIVDDPKKRTKKDPFDGFSFKLIFSPNPYYQNHLAESKLFDNLAQNKNTMFLNVLTKSQEFYSANNQYELWNKLGYEVPYKFKAEKYEYSAYGENYPIYSRNHGKISQKYIDVIKAMNKCYPVKFYSSIKALSTLNSHFLSLVASYSGESALFTKLIDLLFVDISRRKISEKFSKQNIGFDQLNNYVETCLRCTLYNLGHLENINLLKNLAESTVHQRYNSYQQSRIFHSILLSKDIKNIMQCMEVHYFNAETDNPFDMFYDKDLLNVIVDNILTGKYRILDNFLVNLVKAMSDPFLFGYPLPQKSIDFLNYVADRSLDCKRAVVANIVYYMKMCESSGKTIPDYFEIFRRCFKMNEDEMCAFFSLLTCYQTAYDTMVKNPVYSDLCRSNALPMSYLSNNATGIISIHKDMPMFDKVIDSFVLHGLVSHQSHITELTVTILRVMNLGTDLPSKIAPFVEEGLMKLNAGENNFAFIRFATAFIAKHQEFQNCFDAYVKALETIKNYSFTILKENAARKKKGSPFPESFHNLENLYKWIEQTIDDVFTDFKDKEEMSSTSRFCRKIYEHIEKQKPAICKKQYLSLLLKVEFYADNSFEKCVMQDDNAKSLSFLIEAIYHHTSLCYDCPSIIEIIFKHLSLSFKPEHTVLLSKLPREFQHAPNIAKIFNDSIMKNLPDVNDDELTEIISNLGIFADENESESSSDEEPEPEPYSGGSRYLYLPGHRIERKRVNEIAKKKKKSLNYGSRQQNYEEKSLQDSEDESYSNGINAKCFMNAINPMLTAQRVVQQCAEIPQVKACETADYDACEDMNVEVDHLALFN